MSTYAITTPDQIGVYPTIESYRAAALSCVDRARSGETVTLIKVDGSGTSLTFTPLCTFSPPITPTPSTSPEVST